jgi:hypothetical protein
MPKDDTISALSRAFLLPLVERFLQLHGPKWTPTRLGREALNDPAFVFQMRNGRRAGDARADKVIDLIDCHAPGLRAEFIKNHAEANLHAE